jgi:hypothetical protein
MRNDDVIAAIQIMRQGVDMLGRALSRVTTELAESLPTDRPENSAEPGEFQHEDQDGDFLRFSERSDGSLRASINERHDDDANLHAVDLGQETVNQLTQYLDRYRTDTPCSFPADFQCAGMRGHDGLCDPDADDMDTPLDACPWSIRDMTPGTVEHKDCEKPAGHQLHRAGERSWLESTSGAYDRRELPGGLEHDANAEERQHTRDVRALCAGHFPDRPDDSTGCHHFRVNHGALGCTAPWCPCERRGGR